METTDNPLTDKNQAPCLVQCRQGVSVLYKDHYLYSKYDPSKSIKQIISNLKILDETLVLIFSPALWLGLDELSELIKRDCPHSKIIAFEYDKALYNFSKESLSKKNGAENAHAATENTAPLFFDGSNLNSFIDILQSGKFKRVIKIDFSAGVSFNKEKYDELYSLAQSVIDQYWKNKLTLIRFGRLFSKNIFKNLGHLASGIPLNSLYKTIEKPILVLGAGESLDKTIAALKSRDLRATNALRDNFYILCVDAALESLLENGITPDAVVAVEGQLAIEKAYIGKAKNCGVLLIADLVSRSSIPRITGGPVSFFVSEYAKMNFFTRLSERGVLPPAVAPLGSVGLVAMEIALRLRASEDVPVLFSGLDFAFTKGITHAKGTVAHKSQLTKAARLCPVYNIDAAFANGTSEITDKNSKKMQTTKVLFNYALLFDETFSDKKNIFDVSESGVALKFTRKNLNEFYNDAHASENKNPVGANVTETQELLKFNIKKFVKDEIASLNTLKDILTNGENSLERKTTLTLDEQIDSLVNDREYLFIHFPDSIQKTNRQSFLNRIRIEIDFFLKELCNLKF